MWEMKPAYLLYTQDLGGKKKHFQCENQITRQFLMIFYKSHSKPIQVTHNFNCRKEATEKNSARDGNCGQDLVILPNFAPQKKTRPVGVEVDVFYPLRWSLLVHSHNWKVHSSPILHFWYDADVKRSYQLSSSQGEGDKQTKGKKTYSASNTKSQEAGISQEHLKQTWELKLSKFTKKKKQHHLFLMSIHFM